MQQQQEEGEKAKPTPLYIERPPAPAPGAAAAAAAGAAGAKKQAAKTHVLISRLGVLPGLHPGGSSSSSTTTTTVEQPQQLSERVFTSLYAQSPTAFWLDSSATAAPYATTVSPAPGAVPPKNGGRFSYMGDAFSGKGTLGHVLEYYLPTASGGPSLLRILRGEGAAAVEERVGASLFPHLQAALKGTREGGVRLSVVGGAGGEEEVVVPVDRIAEVLPGLEFWGGYVGYLGYELKEDCLRLQRAGGVVGEGDGSRGDSSSHSRDGGRAGLPAAPDAVLVYADRLLAFDHVKGTVDLVAVVPAGEEAAGRAWLRETEARVRALAAATAVGIEEGEKEEEGPGPQLVFAPRVAPEEYKERVDRCLELIAAGETYEVCAWLVCVRVYVCVHIHHGASPSFKQI